MKFTCEQHPGLIVHDLGVTFVDGEAEVDVKTAAALRTLPAELGVREVGKSEGRRTQPE
ncbi:hypothetical protein [Amycolatopsis pittospori]|uniref:hypothetical protein n=1 Tax=Amycolatopsis pittospori TaxID=2749434 RepID=UPI0015F0799C|nr:hypothetical protein [Amycolatopsis pittospori]